MKRSAIVTLPEYFDRYINLADDVELSVAFEKSEAAIKALPLDTLTSLGDKRYAPGKWSVKEVLLHISDAERILSSRALRFARKDGIITQGFDENIFAENSRANERTLDSIIHELYTVRQASIVLYESFNDEVLMRTGINWKYETSVLAMGFILVGHQIHHFNILKEKYYPLVGRE